MSRVFISYALVDQERAIEVYHRLAETEFRPWLDIKDISSGENPAAAIQEAIREADFFLVCLSNESSNEKRLLDPKQRDVVELFLKGPDSAALLVPVCFNGCQLPSSLRAFATQTEEFKLPIDLASKEGWPALLKLLSIVIERRAEIDREYGELTSTESASPASDETMIFREAIDEGPHDTSSPDAWELELYRVLAGEREYLVEHLGSVVQLVEVKIEEANDRTAAKFAFRKALRRVIATWQPLTEQKRYDLYLLDLILEYRPEIGFVRVADMLETLASLPQHATDDSAHHDLFKIALAILEGYSTAPLFSEEAISSHSYVGYLNVLQICITDERYSAYAIDRLLVLRQLDPRGGEIENLIRIPHVMPSLVSMLLEPGRRMAFESALSNVYHYCLVEPDLEARLELEARFREAVANGGWKMKYYDKQPVLHNLSDDRDRLNIKILESDQKAYDNVNLRHRFEKMEDTLQRSDEIQEAVMTRSA